ncbi:MAG TPA: AGE family epimerase/isomerase [Spirochaetales bacterium]|nr:AGE family epimerase/isomerase [Spirochaetales bacterium]
MINERARYLRDMYYRELTENILPFWMSYGIDNEKGGIMDFLDRQGQPLSTDKGGWAQGRATWVFSFLYNNLEQRDSWLRAAKSCADFTRDRILAGPQGRAFFEVDRDGKPLVIRRYLFSEAFAIIGLAEYAKASGDQSYFDKAINTLAVYDEWRGKLEPKVNPAVRPMLSHSDTMIMINVFQVLRRLDPKSESYYTSRIQQRIDDLFTYFVKPKYKAVLEIVGAGGEITEGSEGRTLNPGHSIETSWFLMSEAKRTSNVLLMGKALEILSWSLDLGWDTEFGGLFSFADIEGKQPVQVEWDMKYWWPHCEALIATLMAYTYTGDRRWERWFELIHEYTFSHFPDPIYGEWFGYLHRDGSVANTVKGNHFKACFHIPRCMFMVIRLFDELAKQE